MNEEVKEIVEVEENVVSVMNPYELIQMAVQNNAGADHLEKLMDLQDRYDDKLAKKAFNIAILNFQAECPAIDRNKEGHNCKYATLSHIKKTIQPILLEFGLSYQYKIGYDMEVIDGDLHDALTVTCVLKHVDGHSITNTMKAYPDDSGSKNEIQSRGSAVTYLQRYTLVGILGLTSVDTDDDGKAADAGGSLLSKRHGLAVRTLFETIYIIKHAIIDEQLDVAAEAWFELEGDEKADLWLAPTKGGIFTTDERKMIKSDDFRKAHYGEDVYKDMAKRQEKDD